MLSYFTELNRKRPPVELLDFVSHCTCPIVHAADDLSVMQSLEALPHIARSARAIIGKEKAYWIGPSTIGMRHNPYGARVMENPANCRVAMTDRDPRQTSLFAAAWMIGYVSATAEAALQMLTVGSNRALRAIERRGSWGTRTASGVLHRARAGGTRWESSLRVSFSRPDLVAAVAGVDRTGTRVVWLANLTGQKQETFLDGDLQIQSVFMLDEGSFGAGAVNST